jgi:hypothetical protein
MEADFEIKSKVLGKTVYFWKNPGHSYVYTNLEERGKGLGRQICVGGGFTGSTLIASDESMARVCRRWYRAYIKNYRQWGEM